MQKIKKIDENNKVTIFNNVTEAANSIDTTLESWKVQMLIIDAIIHKKRAFKNRWAKV